MYLRIHFPYPSLIKWMWPFHKHYTYDFIWTCRSILAFPIYEMWCVFAVQSSHFCYIPNRDLLVVGNAALKAVTWNSCFILLLTTVFLFGPFFSYTPDHFWYSTLYELVWNTVTIVLAEWGSGMGEWVTQRLGGLPCLTEWILRV